MKRSYKVFLGVAGAISFALAGLPAVAQQGSGGPTGQGSNRSGGPETPNATPGQIETSPNQTVPGGENPNVSPSNPSPSNAAPAAPDNNAAPGFSSSSANTDSMTLSQVLRNSTSFSLLNSLISLVGATDEGFTKPFTGSGNVTILAPTNQAFAALPEGTIRMLAQPENRDLLVKILENHVVSGDSSAVSERTGGIGAAGSQISASNGTIMPINQVLVPPDVASELQSRVSMVQSMSPTSVGTGSALQVSPGGMR